MKENKKQFITGSEAVVQGAIDAGAEMMYGYPITPTTEILTGWIKKGKKYLQTEDEIAAGFAVCGAVISGQKAFTATAGPGHVLMQDGLSMAEGMRLPFVIIVGQRGGPSSGTVIYSQQEVNLACFGGNGEGFRLVYAPSSLEELYHLTVQAFNDAWKYRFPAFVLTDGYLLKTSGIADLEKSKEKATSSYTLINEGDVKHWRNIYTFEEELYEELLEHKKDFEAAAKEIAVGENYEADDAELLLVAHGIVAGSAKQAIKELRNEGYKVGLFRPITLRPFPVDQFNKIARKVKKIIVIESSLGQLAGLVREEMAPEIATPFDYMQSPALGIEPDDIVNFVRKI